MRRRRLLQRLSEGNVRNARFGDFVNLVDAFGFRLIRVTGSHHIYSRNGVPELINLQDDHGEAKAYQVRQFLRLVERYNLELEERQ